MPNEQPPFGSTLLCKRWDDRSVSDGGTTTNWETCDVPPAAEAPAGPRADKPTKQKYFLFKDDNTVNMGKGHPVGDVLFNPGCCHSQKVGRVDVDLELVSGYRTNGFL